MGVMLSAESPLDGHLEEGAPMEQASLVAMSAFLDRFRAHVDAQRDARTEALVALFEQFGEHLASSTRPTRFNVLQVTGVRSDEVKHSSLLAWLLNPHGSHGCGTRFLQSFLAALGISLPPDDLVGCHVRTEFPGNESIIDILVYKPAAFLLYVENKVFASEGEDQVARELRDMRRLGEVVRVEPDSWFPVFLTPSGRAPRSGDPAPWYCLSYARLANDFEALLPDLEGKIAFFIEDLVDQYRRWNNA